MGVGSASVSLLPPLAPFDDAPIDAYAHNYQPHQQHQQHHPAIAAVSDGPAALSLPLALSPSLAGITLTAQGIASSGGAGTRVATSASLRVEISLQGPLSDAPSLRVCAQLHGPYVIGKEAPGSNAAPVAIGEGRAASVRPSLVAQTEWGAHCLCHAEDARAAVTMSVTSPRLWSAEEPCLYRLVLSIKSSNLDGSVIDRIATDTEGCWVGFREVVVSGARLLVNGVQVKVRGVNRHDHCPKRGRQSRASSQLAVQLPRWWHMTAPTFKL